MATQRKIDTVKKLKDDFEKSKTIVLTNHSGLTHKQLEVLRKNIKKSGGDFTIAKNTLIKRALNGTDFEDLIQKQTLEGPTSILLSFEDEIAPIRELIKTNRELNLPKIKQGALKERSLTDKEVIRLADLPSKDVLISQLIGMIQAPQTRLILTLKGNLTKLVLILKAITEKKEEEKN